MTDNEIKREKTFSEELPYFKEQIKEVFDNYHNPDGSEDPLHISILRDSYRIVLKAEEEIACQQAENKRLEKEVNLVSIQFQDLQERYEESQAEIERFRKTEIEIDDFCRRLCRMRMLNGNAIASYEDLENYIQQEKSKAVKEFAEKMKKYIDVGHLRPPTEICFSELDVVKMIDKTAEEILGE